MGKITLNIKGKKPHQKNRNNDVYATKKQNKKQEQRKGLQKEITKGMIERKKNLLKDLKIPVVK